MRATRRRLIAVLASVALVAGVPAVAAGSASAASSTAPTDVFAFGVNYGYEVHWGAPDGGVVGLTGFAVTLSATGSATEAPRTAVLPASARSTRFSGLTPGTSYVAEIVADFGGTPSDPAYSNVARAYQPVGAPPVRVVVGRNALTVRWSAPRTSAATGPMLRYVVRTGSPGSDTWVAPGQRSLRLVGLTNGRRYVVTVIAVAGDVGGAAWSAGTPIGPPARPTKLKRTWKKGGKAKLTWKGARSTAAGPVTGYYVYVNGRKVATLSKSARSYTAKKEKKGKRYSFAVRARNPIALSTAAVVHAKKRPIK